MIEPKPSTFRNPTQQEQSVFDALLANSFEGRNEIEVQLMSAKVRVIDENGSLEIKPIVKAKATVRHRIPREVFAKDEDGVTIHALLHVVNGNVIELEFYKDDSSSIIQFPTTWEALIQQ